MNTRLDFIILAAGNPDTRLDKAPIMEIRYQSPLGILNGSFKVWGLFSCQIHVFHLVNTKYYVIHTTSKRDQGSTVAGIDWNSM